MIGDLTASTLTTLLLIPVVYVSATSLLERVRAVSWSFRRDSADVEPAR